jgi:hypothetical protein
MRNVFDRLANTIAENTKYMIMSRHQNSGQNQNIRIANESFENVATFKYLGRGQVFTGFWLGGPKARDHWEDLSVGRRITLKWTLGR